ncbi:urease accessory protein UreE [Vibrio sp. ABG19]|uniref:urease accessory protein UreE n=1 Tax=Gammaproteobacteria TaxID=1236 RepID=UPI00249DAA8A|nr:urease accessory protein UreE [Vibrio sp. ABG19]WGY47303.1 urease accessory protein UreE [Vibrio sp. ABG19]
MFRVIRRIADAEHQSPVQVADQVMLPFDVRQKGRFRTQSAQGHDVGVFLERGEVLQSGDHLLTECGQRFAVVAEQEAVIEASCSDWQVFARACYHMGNRHVPMQIGERWLRFQPDHVLQEMLELLGMACRAMTAEFSPENGAYHGRGGHTHGGHSHGHAHSHDHSLNPNHRHDHHHSHSDHQHEEHNH